MADKLTLKQKQAETKERIRKLNSTVDEAYLDLVVDAVNDERNAAVSVDRALDMVGSDND